MNLSLLFVVGVAVTTATPSALIDCLRNRELFDNLNPGLFSNTTATFSLASGSLFEHIWVFFTRIWIVLNKRPQ